mmetsp:Transcript_871/g.1975  ORF Transcript_871/g.1975 Transcript_871/m.1975 type:complete len:216 (-) Transcript_871:948-1595(-)
MNSVRLSLTSLSMSRTAKASFKEPNCLMSRSRMSSRSREGEMAAKALLSSFKVVVPFSSLVSLTFLKMTPCSISSVMPTRSSIGPNSVKVNLREMFSREGSISLITCRMDPKPKAIHFLRKSSKVLTGVWASIALSNSFREMDPFLSLSRNSKMLSCSSFDRWTKCLCKKRWNSLRESSGVFSSAMKVSNASDKVENCSSIFCRNCRRREMGPRS